MKSIEQIKQDYLMDLITDDQFLAYYKDVSINGKLPKHYYTIGELFQLINKSNNVDILTGFLTILEKTFEQLGSSFIDDDFKDFKKILKNKINFVCDELKLEPIELFERVPHTYQLLFVDKSK